MKRYHVVNYHHLLAQIDLQKIDKEARTRLIDLDIAMGAIVDGHEAEVEKIKSRLIKGHEDEIQAVSELINQLQIADDKEAIKIKIAEHKEYAAIQMQLNEEVNRKLMEDVQLEIDKVTSAELAQWCAESAISINLEVLRELRSAGLTL